MHTNILVVYKKNFEEVHDMALATIRQALDELVSENRVRVDYTARETVRPGPGFCFGRGWHSYFNSPFHR